MTHKRDDAWLWLGLGIASMLLAAVQFMDMLRRNELVVDALFFLLAFGAAMYFLSRWARYGHRRPWEDDDTD